MKEIFVPWRAISRGQSTMRVITCLKIGILGIAGAWKVKKLNFFDFKSLVD